MVPGVNTLGRTLALTSTTSRAMGESLKLIVVEIALVPLEMAVNGIERIVELPAGK